jgi:hypothetical protein
LWSFTTSEGALPSGAATSGEVDLSCAAADTAASSERNARKEEFHDVLYGQIVERRLPKPPVIVGGDATFSPHVPGDRVVRVVRGRGRRERARIRCCN